MQGVGCAHLLMHPAWCRAEEVGGIEWGEGCERASIGESLHPRKCSCLRIMILIFKGVGFRKSAGVSGRSVPA